MMTLPEIREALKDRRTTVVAEVIDCRVATIVDIREGRTLDPSYRIVKALSDYLSGGDNA